MLTVTFICLKRPFPLASTPPKHPKIQHTAGGRYIYPSEISRKEKFSAISPFHRIIFYKTAISQKNHLFQTPHFHPLPASTPSQPLPNCPKTPPSCPIPPLPQQICYQFVTQNWHPLTSHLPASSPSHLPPRPFNTLTHPPPSSDQNINHLPTPHF